jgi:uncharacterized tellurite resistance protein B-like protein
VNNHTFYSREIFGQSIDFPPDLITKCAKAQLIIAGADGLSQQELDDCHGLGRVFGATEAMIDEIKKFDFKKAKLEDNLPAEIRPFARQFIYFAIKVASADGNYAERASVARAAKLLGVDPMTVKLIESLVEAERGLRSARMMMLAPA